MIDIVVTYLNEKNETWKQDYIYWKNKEIETGKADPNNRQAFGIERIRGWDNFQYWFRGVEENCPWLNKVFLVVQNEDHIPTWLKKDHPKLRIVYHEEFIPEKLRPTFNAMTIGMYISNIPDLSETYIMCDDDYFFLNPIKENRFFRGEIPVHKNNKIRYEFYHGDVLKGTDSVFYRALNQSIEFEKRFLKENIRYGFYHLPEARKKSFEQKILNDYPEEIESHFIWSKFRNQHNICPTIYCDLLKICNVAIIDDPYYNCAYCDLRSNIDFNIYWGKDIVCFNDTERLDDYEKTKDKLIDFLDRKFPNKSTFEKE